MKSITYSGVTYQCPFADAVRPLTSDERAALKASIQATGRVTVPVIVDQDNNVIDGHNRLEIAAELGVPCPIQQSGELTADAKRRLAVDLNVHRRQLTRVEIQAMLAQRLKADPAKSDREIARESHVSDKTVGAARRRLEATAEIPQLTETTGRDGKTRERNPQATTKGSNPCTSSPDYVSAVIDREKRQARKAKAEGRAEAAAPDVHEGRPDGEIKSRGIGVRLANEAINQLIRIPKDDALRARAFEIVADFVARQDAAPDTDQSKKSKDMHTALNKVVRYADELVRGKPRLGPLRDSVHAALQATRDALVTLERASAL